MFKKLFASSNMVPEKDRIEITYKDVKTVITNPEVVYSLYNVASIFNTSTNGTVPDYTKLRFPELDNPCPFRGSYYRRAIETLFRNYNSYNCVITHDLEQLLIPFGEEVWTFTNSPDVAEAYKKLTMINGIPWAKQPTVVTEQVVDLINIFLDGIAERHPVNNKESKDV